MLAEVLLDETATIPIATGHREIAALALDGNVAVNDEDLTVGRLAVLRSDSTIVLSGRGRVIVLGGEPVGRRHIW